MAIPTFVQKSRINQVIYQIRGDLLSVSERRLMGRFQDREINLRWLDPDYRPGITRHYTGLLVSLLLASLCALSIWGMFMQTIIPREALPNILQFPAVGFAVFFAAAVQWSRRIEFYLFNNQAGHPVLVIIRERAQAEECAAFINLLVAHIKIAQGDLTDEEQAGLRQKLAEDDSLLPVAAPGLALWKISLVLGVLAAGLPWIPDLDQWLFGFLFPVVFGCCIGGVALSVFSFSKNEPQRWWSAIGLALSLIPPFFY